MVYLTTAAAAEQGPPLPALTPQRGVGLNLAAGMPTPLRRVNKRAEAAPQARQAMAHLLVGLCCCCARARRLAS